MRIGIIADTWEGTIGLRRYANQFILNLSDILDPEDELCIFYSSSSAIDSYIKNKLDKMRNVKFLLIDLHGIPLGKQFRQMVILPHLCKTVGLDVLHDLYQMGPFFIDKNQYLKVLTIHDLIPLIFENKGIAKSITTKINYKLVLPRIIENSNLIIVPSQCTKRDVQKYYNLDDKIIKVIPQGIDLDFFKPTGNSIDRNAIKKRFNLNSSKRIVMSFVSDSPVENTKGVLDAYSELRKRNAEVQLVLVGKHYREFIEMVKKDSLQDVFFTGFVSERDLTLLYSIADVFLYLSLYEGFGLPPLEAMACDTPTIVSNNSSIPEVVGDAAIIVDPWDASKVAMFLTDLLFDKSMRKYYIAKGRDRVKVFKWRRTTNDSYLAYKEFL